MPAAQRPADITPEQLREAVRDRYTAVASEPAGHYSFRVGRDFAEALGYPAELLDSVPSHAVEAFTGVATPMPRAELQPGETVLDLGCGGGLDLALAARAVGPTGRVIGVDMAETMVERATATVRALDYTWAEARVAYAEALPLAAATVDCVVANGILNLSPDKSAVLTEIARVLKPGGRFVLAETTLRHELPPDAVQDLEDWFRWIGGALPERSLLDTIKAAGLEPEVLERGRNARTGAEASQVSLIRAERRRA